MLKLLTKRLKMQVNLEPCIGLQVLTLTFENNKIDYDRNDTSLIYRAFIDQSNEFR